ncbi:MAG TPA: phage integrase N-terminal SAM-like domain-containing protein [Thermoanaerobaculia bacterium]|jgi:hypothetical protein
MGEMRDRMEKELKLRGYSPATIKAYLRVVHSFVQHHRRPAETMGSSEARAYLLHPIEEKHLAWPTVLFLLPPEIGSRVACRAVAI